MPTYAGQGTHELRLQAFVLGREEDLAREDVETFSLQCLNLGHE